MTQCFGSSGIQWLSESQIMDKNDDVYSIRITVTYGTQLITSCKILTDLTFISSYKLKEKSRSIPHIYFSVAI